MPLALGAGIGLMLFFAAFQIASTAVSGLPGNQWLAVVAALLVVTVAALVATLIPSRSAVRIPPAEAMRV